MRLVPVNVPRWFSPSPPSQWRRASDHHASGLGVSRMTDPKPRRRVLIVEDEAPLRMQYERALQGRYDLVFAATGAEAMVKLEEHRPDLAVLDMRLPDIDGVTLLRKIRLSRPQLPVIITTAYMSIEPQLQLLDVPYSDYIVKPFRLDELGARIDAAL